MMASEAGDIDNAAKDTAKNMSVKALFDSVGPAYENAFANLKGQDTAIKWLVDSLGPKSKVLDVGCATGRPVCSSLYEAGHTVLGIDVSPEMLNFAREHVPGPLFAQFDVKDFDADPEGFHAIAVFFSMLADFTQDEIKQQLERIYGWLKPGGLLVWATIASSAESQQMKWLGRDVVVSALSAEASLKAVQDAGFIIVDKSEQTFKPKAVEAGICTAEDVWEEPHLFVHARKPESKP